MQLWLNFLTDFHSFFLGGNGMLRILSVPAAKINGTVYVPILVF